jgi:Fic family protein
MPSPGHAAESWPAIRWEELSWTPRISLDLVSRSVRRRHQGRYAAALVPPIAHAALVLPPAIAALDSEASIEIARFDAEMGADLAPFASVLLRSESASSSRIENLTAGAKAIAMAEMGSRQQRTATEIVGNVAAMTAALALSDHLDAEAILAMHEALLRDHDPDIAGRWRSEPVWIGGDNIGPHGATFVPPQHTRIASAIDDLLLFIDRTDLPVLTQTAIAHAQFETIHPFADGNGRTGRALIHAMFRGQGLTRNVTVPVSAGLLVDTSAYFDTLTAYRDGDPLAIVSVVAEASFAAVANARILVTALRELRASWTPRVRARQGASAWNLLDLLLRQPVVDTPTIVRELGISSANAMRPVEPLVGAGILTEFTGFTRNRMWQAREVLTALDAFAARAGRRGSGAPSAP